MTGPREEDQRGPARVTATWVVAAGVRPQWQEGNLPRGHNHRARLRREEGGLQPAARAQNHHTTTQRPQGELGDRGTLPGKESTRFQTKTGLRFPTKSDH